MLFAAFNPEPVRGEPGLLASGGPMIWVLLLLTAALALLLAERMFFLRHVQIQAREFVDGIKNILAKRRLGEAQAVCDETPGPVAAVVKVALVHAGDDEMHLRHAVQEAAILALPTLERRLGAIAAIAQVAPLLGLLGTVLGMLVTFRAFSSGGAEYQTAKALADGMWQALFSTAGSLLLAILARVAQYVLAGRVRAVVDDIEWSANEIMRYLLTDYRTLPAAAEEKGGGP
ncbi:MAG: MotA/TolQ/ExbB proton channel family protein [Verrucomicrobiota bacterium]